VTVKHEHVIGRSPKFINSLDLAKRVANSHASVLITGESGTGKEIFAKYIHNESKSSKGPFVAINCSAIPENLLESELFGHAKGSFTGAQENRVGLFEEAQNGTLFLDEIGDLSLPLQSKLLRVLQEKKIKRVGENQYRQVNCRIISATHKNLSIEVKDHRFREDLYFRLDVIPIFIPPLRERLEDIMPLAEYFLKKYAAINFSVAKYFSKDSIKYLLTNKWQGNIRELENTIERATVLCNQIEVSLDDLIPLSESSIENMDKNVLDLGDNTFYITHSEKLPSLDEVIQKYIQYAVNKKSGARDQTAKEIGIDRKTLYKRLQSQNQLSTI
jgi:two-component system response regulator HydG